MHPWRRHKARAPRPAPQIPRQGVGPGYWMHETSGALRPVIEAYLAGEPLVEPKIVLMRAYLRQWIMAPVWVGGGIQVLREGIAGLTSREAIKQWLEEAMAQEIDPL